MGRRLEAITDLSLSLWWGSYFLLTSSTIYTCNQSAVQGAGIWQDMRRPAAGVANTRRDEGKNAERTASLTSRCAKVWADAPLKKKFEATCRCCRTGPDARNEDDASHLRVHRHKRRPLWRGMAAMVVGGPPCHLRRRKRWILEGSGAWSAGGRPVSPSCLRSPPRQVHPPTNRELEEKPCAHASLPSPARAIRMEPSHG